MQVNRKGLADTVRGVRPAVLKRSGIPALSCVELTYDGLTVEARATDLELTLRRALVVEGGTGPAWSALVPAKELEAALKSSTGSAIELEPATIAVGTDQAPALRVGPTLIRCEPVEDFPKLEDYSQASHGAIFGAPELAELLAGVLPAASRDEARPVLTGVLFSSTRDGLELVATDSYRMHAGALSACSPMVGAEPMWSAIVPERALRELVKMLGRRPAGTVSVYVNGEGKGDHWRATGLEILSPAGGGVLAVRAIDGEFPNWRQLVPDRPYDAELLKIDGPELTGAIRGAGAIGGESPALLAWDGFAFNVSARGSEGATFGPVSVSSSGSAPAVSVGVNPAYFGDALEAAGEGAPLYVRDGLKPLVFFGDRVTALVMPVRMPAIVAPDVKAAPVKVAEPWSPAQARKAPEPVEAPEPEPDCPGCGDAHGDGRCCRCGEPEHGPVRVVAPEHAADGIGGTYPAGPVEPARDALSSGAITTAPAWSELVEVGGVEGVMVRLVVGPDGEPWVKVHRRAARKGGATFDKPGPTFPVGLAAGIAELLEGAGEVAAEL